MVKVMEMMAYLCRATMAKACRRAWWRIINLKINTLLYNSGKFGLNIFKNNCFIGFCLET
jgi:hypothetical protein